jgi:hypothetical protein
MTRKIANYACIGTPRCQANVLARMVVFTSGIVDGRVSCVQLVWVWVVWLLMALRWWGMGSSTLLGPEESAGMSLASCVGVGGVWLGLLVLSSPERMGAWHVWSCDGTCGVCVRGLVGLLFEICIVDASIFVACSASSVGGGGRM